MGCDIHLFREKRVGDTWQCLDPFVEVEENDGHKYIEVDDTYIPRNYDLFGFLADVRIEVPEGFQSRSLPKDVSHEVKQESYRWDHDGHSHSYLLLSELKTKLTELLIAPTKHSPHYVSAVKNIVELFPQDSEEYRIVFWFDN